MLRVVLLMLLLLAPPAWAGAWPRGEGRAFIAAMSYATETDRYSGVYAEWGQSDRLTLGGDLGRSVSGRDKQVVFLRYHLPANDRPARLALEIGAGRIGQQSVLRPGLAWGRGITLAGQHGWLALDLQAEIYPKLRHADAKLDLTYGIEMWPDVTGIMQLQAGMQRGDEPFLRLVPSVVWNSPGPARWEIGVTQSLRGTWATGAKLALWLEF